MRNVQVVFDKLRSDLSKQYEKASKSIEAAKADYDALAAKAAATAELLDKMAGKKNGTAPKDEAPPPADKRKLSEIPHKVVASERVTRGDNQAKILPHLKEYVSVTDLVLKTGLDKLQVRSALGSLTRQKKLLSQGEGRGNRQYKLL